jgi:hypothetical protein
VIGDAAEIPPQRAVMRPCWADSFPRSIGGANG